ncbi:pre-mRNA-splicing factor ISY1 [Favolaschia claudopus]|uniref:Pre-mRNA-splicing factor ISY1 n=1 Tax=Favolaschia claudopus TaxID=2862362 RepID=A0AAW0AFQ9_9AGAR
MVSCCLAPAFSQFTCVIQARNQEKAQSMLYRFREAQAAELGLGTRSDRRPKVASACKSLRECERWRSELLREISRKVAKIQDAGLSDYEVRDLNDEINKLLREKRHWENQIVALGGANYRRNVAMLDDDGKEVPGTKGYKYFGRAKQLPGVRELFRSRTTDEDEDNQASSFYGKFLAQGPQYYGDFDENDASLVRFENEAEGEDWESACSRLRIALCLPQNKSIPNLPRSLPLLDSARREPLSTHTPSSIKEGNSLSDLQIAASYIPFLTAEMLLSPKLPTRTEWEAALLALRKKVLIAEYFGDEEL